MTLAGTRPPTVDEWEQYELHHRSRMSTKELINNLFDEYKPAIVVNLAAQAGVRYSITNPDAYVESNPKIAEILTFFISGISGLLGRL